MIRNLILKFMALVFVMGVTMTPAMAASHEHDSDHKASKHDNKDKHDKKDKSDDSDDEDEEAPEDGEAMSTH